MEFQEKVKSWSDHGLQTYTGGEMCNNQKEAGCDSKAGKESWLEMQRED